MSINRIKAIFIKELQDVRLNSNILFMLSIPIIITVIYKYFIPGMSGDFVLSFGLLFLTVMVGMYVPSMLISEEKEKHTLQVLLLSPAKPVDVFIGKGLLTFISIIACALVLLIIGNIWDNLLLLFLSLTLVSIVCILLGMIVGLLAQNQMATGAIGFPLYMLFIMIPFLAAVNNQSIISKISAVLPTYHFVMILNKIYTDTFVLKDVYPHFLAILLACIISFLALYAVYRKRGFKE